MSARERGTLLLFAPLLLWARVGSAQVNWDDLFAEEPAKPAAPVKPIPPPAQAPVAPARPAPAAQAPVAPRPPQAPPPARRAQQPAAAKPALAEKPVAAPAPVAQPKPAVPRREPAVAAVEPPPVAKPPAKRAAAPVEEPPAAQPAAVAPRAAARPASNGGGPASSVRLADLGLEEGTVISIENLKSYEKLLSPGMQWGVGYGWRLNVQETRQIFPLRAYREATEKYAGQVRLGPGGKSIENYVAGQPFPNLDPNDPDIAVKIMWNFSYGWAYTDDIDIRLFDGDTGTIAPGEGMKVERHYIVDHLRRLYYTGRLFVDPKPQLPNDEGFRFKESLHPLLEPFDLKGVGGTFYRYLDPNRHDDSWLYLPQLRRVRRLSSAQRSDALFGQDTDVDSYYGYNGHIAWNTYKFLGEQTILAPMHARNVPVKWQNPEDYFFDDYWEPRTVWVVEATSTLPQYAYGKRVVFVDKEAFVIPYTDIYDRAGQLWKIWVNMYSFRKKAVPNAKTSVYDEEMAFGNAVVVYDMLLAHATRGALPSIKTVSEEGWLINMGEKSGTSENFFTVAHLIETGH